MENNNTESTKKTSRVKKVAQLSPHQEQMILSWLKEGLDAKTASLLFESETGEEIDTASVIALWKKHSAKLQLERRKYFAQLASELVDDTLAGEQALDTANTYLLKQTLFELLIEPEKDPRQIELLVKAIKSVAQDKNGESKSNTPNHTSPGLTEDTLSQIESMAKII